MSRCRSSAPSLAACIAALLAASPGVPAFAAAGQANPVDAAPGLAQVARELLSGAHRRGVTRAAPAAMTAGITIPVSSCADDDGFDTLRHAVLIANPGDTVDLSALACSKITLQAGAIAVGAADLTIVGPGLTLAQAGYYPGATRWPFMGSGPGLAFTAPGPIRQTLCCPPIRCPPSSCLR